MFSSTKKKLVAVATLTMMLMALGTVAATAHRVPACDNDHGRAPIMNPHCSPLHDQDPPGDPGEDEDGDNLIDIGIGIKVILLVDLDVDVLEVLELLDGVSLHDKLEWLHGHISLGDKIDWLLGVIDLDDVYDHFGWVLQPGHVLGLVGFVTHGLLGGIFEGDLLEGEGGGGSGSDCSGLVVVCNNASGNTVTDVLDVNDVLDVCTITGQSGFGNGNDAGNNNDCDVLDLGGDLLGGGDDGILELVELGDVLHLVHLF